MLRDRDARAATSLAPLELGRAGRARRRAPCRAAAAPDRRSGERVGVAVPLDFQAVEDLARPDVGRPVDDEAEAAFVLVRAPAARRCLWKNGSGSAASRAAAPGPELEASRHAASLSDGHSAIVSEARAGDRPSAADRSTCGSLDPAREDSDDGFDATVSAVTARSRSAGASYRIARLAALEKRGLRAGAAAVRAAHPAREPAAPRGRPSSCRRGHRGAGSLGRRRPSRSREIAFMPARVLLQDFTGVPAVVDLAAMRDAMRAMGGDPTRINPLQPVELVIDHSVQVDEYGSEAALPAQRRARVRAQPRALRLPALGPEGVPQLPRRAARHRHRPPGEPRVPGARGDERRTAWAYPDTLVGTDSHTTMINGLGRARLGRRRHRGRGGDARPAGRRC